MKQTLTRIEKLEISNKSKLNLSALVAECEKMVANLINNPQPNRRIEDYMGDNENG